MKSKSRLLKNKIKKFSHENNKENNITSSIFCLTIGGILGLIGILIPIPNYLKYIIIIASYIILIWNTLLESIEDLKKKRIDETFLVCISTLGAFLLGEIHEGLMIAFLHDLGELIEKLALGRSRKSISKLMNIKEDTANVKKEGIIHKVNIESVSLNDITVVKKGEKVPLDGIVTMGTSYLDTSAITGESHPVKVEKGDKVISGTINKEEVIEIKVTSLYKDSTVNKILELVETATERKSRTESFVSKYASIYTYVAISLSLIVSIFLPIFTDIPVSESIYKGLTILLIACPCAIVISIPLSYFSGLGRASQSGILIKGSNYLDGLKNVKDIIFDKTGTITTGNFSIANIDIYDKNYSKEEVLKIFVGGESLSNHPIAKSITKSLQKSISALDIKSFKEIVGEGITFKYQNKSIKIGSAKLCSVKKNNHNSSNIYLSIDDKLVAEFEIKDEIKENAKAVIDSLHSMNIISHLFTGDSKEKASYISTSLKINDVKYEMLPTDKYSEVEKLIKEKKGEGLVSFVGDGINDAPVIAMSDIGISMGKLGTDSAIEASDIVIMNDNLENIVTAIEISKKTNRIIKENLIFALLVKIAILVLSLFGITTMWEAVFADVGVTIICILNSLRILKNNI